ncbi:MAG: mercuric transporter MerT family protein [Gammaproteobacteria bacterium]|nr:mercuric transporter MerT family protein [Gammaproteobacteria bacterium]MCY4356920.1 mercuric transporter MerT family protein [Gammaproteobacteria bacterium]
MDQSNKRTSSFLIAGVLTSVVSSACCLGPLFLLATGLSAAWMSQLMSLETFHPLFATATIVMFGIAGRRIDWSKTADSAESNCQVTQQHIMFKIGYLFLSTLALALISSIWWIQYLG